jgi:plastocyanin
VRWLAVVLAAALAAGWAGTASAARKHHRVTPAHRLAKKPPKHKGVTFQRPLPSASPVPQGSPGSPQPTPVPTAAPTPPATETRTGVDVDDRNDQLVMRLAPYNVLKAGTVELLPINLGEDDHNLTVRNSAGVDLDHVDLPPDGETYSLVLDLPPGQYKLFCSLLNHDELGMHTTLTVR